MSQPAEDSVVARRQEPISISLQRVVSTVSFTSVERWVTNHLFFLATFVANRKTLSLRDAVETFDDFMADALCDPGNGGCADFGSAGRPNPFKASFEHYMIWHTRALDPVEYQRRYRDVAPLFSVEDLAVSLLRPPRPSVSGASSAERIAGRVAMEEDVAAQIPFTMWALAKRRNVAFAYDKYIKFLELHRRYPTVMLAPTKEIDLVWHTHMRQPRAYQNMCRTLFGHIFSHNDKIGPVASARLLEETKGLWRTVYGESMEKTTTDKLGQRRWYPEVYVLLPIRNDVQIAFPRVGDRKVCTGPSRTPDSPGERDAIVLRKLEMKQRTSSSASSRHHGDSSSSRGGDSSSGTDFALFAAFMSGDTGGGCGGGGGGCSGSGCVAGGGCGGGSSCSGGGCGSSCSGGGCGGGGGGD